MFYSNFQSQKIWQIIKRITATDVPKDIQIVLSETGFDSLLSIASLKKENLVEVENYINKNESVLRKLCEYKDADNSADSSQVFNLKPGHQAIITELQRRVEKHLEAKIQKKSPQIAPEKTDDTLKLELVNKLQSYLRKINSNIAVGNENLFDFHRKKNSTYSCHVQCSLCQKRIICTYTTHWAVSNLETHFKNHPAVETNPFTLALTPTNIHQIDRQNIGDLQSVLADAPIIIIEDNVISVSTSEDTLASTSSGTSIQICDKPSGNLDTLD